MMFWTAILTAVFFSLVACWLAFGVRQIQQVSSGPKISGRNGHALILIDLQTVFWDGDAYSNEQKLRAKEAILAAAAEARAKGTPVIALRQEWSQPATRAVARLMMRGQALAGSPGTEIAAPFVGLADHVITKRVQDGFETGELDALLDDLGVGTLHLAGLDLDYCVLRTAQAARKRGYEVEVLPNATLQASNDPTQTNATLKTIGVSEI